MSRFGGRCEEHQCPPTERTITTRSVVQHSSSSSATHHGATTFRTTVDINGTQQCTSSIQRTVQRVHAPAVVAPTNVFRWNRTPPAAAVDTLSSSSRTSPIECSVGSAPAASTEPKGTAFAQQCLQAHNDHRRRHGSAPLSLDAEITKHAQKWADQLARSGRMAHNPDRRYGENVYTCSGMQPTGQSVCDAWYNEIVDYNFRRAQFSSGTGHFTAVVWCATQRLGVGRASSANGQVFVVANYDPAGNVMGQFERNVRPLTH